MNPVRFLIAYNLGYVLYAFQLDLVCRFNASLSNDMYFVCFLLTNGLFAGHKIVKYGERGIRKWMKRIRKKSSQK